MRFDEKMRVLISNNGWTQRHLAEVLHVQPTTVQKWCVGRNTPRIDLITDICDIFALDYNDLLDDSIDIPEYHIIDRYLPYSQYRFDESHRDNEHIIIDACLARGARLHRFRNADGAECSAIYIGSYEHWWHYREHEPYMIREWNREALYDR